jgi:hypothetical protein
MYETKIPIQIPFFRRNEIINLNIGRFDNIKGIHKKIVKNAINISKKWGKSNNQFIHSKDKSRAYGLVVMTSPSHGGGLRFKSG